VSTQSTGGGVGVYGLLIVLFVGLKLGHVIDWSWWWVTAPFWFVFPVAAVLFADYFVVLATVALLASFRIRSRSR
jgi:hypothetical protein